MPGRLTKVEVAGRVVHHELALAGLAAMSTLAGDDAGGLGLYERALTGLRPAGPPR